MNWGHYASDGTRQEPWEFHEEKRGRKTKEGPVRRESATSHGGIEELRGSGGENGGGKKLAKMKLKTGRKCWGSAFAKRRNCN